MIGVDEGSGQGETIVIRLLVVDDHVVVRSGLIALLEGKNDIHIVGDAADGDEAIAKAAELAKLKEYYPAYYPGKADWITQLMNETKSSLHGAYLLVGDDRGMQTHCH